MKNVNIANVKDSMEKAKKDPPKLPKKKQDLASENIAEHMKHEHPGGRKQAIAIGISQAREGKKEPVSKAEGCDHPMDETCPKCEKLEKPGMKKSEGEPKEGLEKARMKKMHDEDTMKKMMSRSMERGIKKASYMGQMEKYGYDMEKAPLMWDEMEKAYKAKMGKADKKDLKDKDSPTKAEPKPKPEDAKGGMPKDEKPAKDGRVRKGIAWNSKTDKLLKASIRRGQNCHYDVEDYLIKSEAEQAETIKKGEYLNDVKPEPLAKAEGAPARKETTANMIEQKLDMSTEKLDRVMGLSKSKPFGGFNTQSFEVEDLAKSMGLTIEKASEILGEDLKKKK